MCIIGVYIRDSVWLTEGIAQSETKIGDGPIGGYKL